MPANSGIGRSIPLPSQANAGDLFILQLSTGNLAYIHNGLLWIPLVDISTPQQLLNKTFDATSVSGALSAGSLAVSGGATAASLSTTGLVSVGGALTAASLAVTNAGSVGGLLTTAGITASGRIQGKQGVDVISTSNLTLGTGNIFNVSGTTNINRLDSTGWQNGSQVSLFFSGALHVVDAAAPSGAFLPFILAGSVDFVTVSGCTLTLVLEANGWWEIARMVP